MCERVMYNKLKKEKDMLEALEIWCWNNAENTLDWNKTKWRYPKESGRITHTDRYSIEKKMADNRAHAEAWW